jgi:carboxyl-terminal processing protease
MPSQSIVHRLLSHLRSPALVLTAGLSLSGLLAVAVAPAGAVSPAATTTGRPEVDRWSDALWQAAKSGDLEAVEAALAQVPEATAGTSAADLRAIVAARAEHLDATRKAREADMAKALEDLQAERTKGEVTKALTAAVRLQTLSDDWAEALEHAEVRALISDAEKAAAQAEADGDWLVAQEIQFRLRTLFDESGDAAVFRRYDHKLDEINKRIMLLAQYAPRELWKLRKAYAERQDPDKPFPEFNDAFGDDWREQLDGISKGMLSAALMKAANKHISAGGWEPIVRGGLAAVRVLATTPTLAENFEGMADAAKASMLRDAVDARIEDLARKPREQVGRPDYLSALRTVLQANAEGPQIPETVIYREFGDGALEELAGRFEDEYTQIIWPEQLRRFEQSIKGDFIGVGIQIRHDDRRDIQVTAPLEGGPAARGGVKSDDRIVAVNGVSTVGWTLNKAVDSITGPAGEEVVLSVRREGADDPIDIPLKRERIKIRTVNGWWKKALDTAGAPLWDWYADPDAGIGYVRLTSFADDSFTDFQKAVAEMRAERPLRGLILDLRHNPGGRLDSAIQFSNLFIERGPIVAVQDRNRRPVWQQGAEPQRAYLKDLPLVVLVNQGSASASEIVSGVLKSYDRAVVIGERSFGKGSVQEVEECGDQNARAAIKVTTQYYVLPPAVGEAEWRLVHKKPGSTDWGVAPDLVVKMTPDQIEKSLTLRADADVIEEWKPEDERKERPDVADLVGKGIDPQLELAVAVLKARTLKDVEAAAQAAATRTGSGPAGG